MFVRHLVVFLVFPGKYSTVFLREVLSLIDPFTVTFVATRVEFR